MRTIAPLFLLGGIALGADDPKPAERIDDPLKYLAGTWIETSVKYSGDDLIEPPRTSNHLAFDGKNFTESTNTGQKLLEAEFTLVSKDNEYWEFDLPRKILIPGKTGEKNRIIVLTVAAIFRPIGKDELQIAHYDPELKNPKKRPNVFESTATNGIVLITLKRKKEKARPNLNAVLRVEINKKREISLRFDLPGNVDQSFDSAEYRYAVLDKDGVQVNDEALKINGAAVHTVSLPKDQRSVVDESEFEFDPRQLKSGEDYYLVVSVRNLTGLAKFKAP